MRVSLTILQPARVLERPVTTRSPRRRLEVFRGDACQLGSLLAHSRDAQCADECPFWGAKQTFLITNSMSANDPKRTPFPIRHWYPSEVPDRPFTAINSLSFQLS